MFGIYRTQSIFIVKNQCEIWFWEVSMHEITNIDISLLLLLLLLTINWMQCCHWCINGKWKNYIQRWKFHSFWFAHDYIENRTVFFFWFVTFIVEPWVDWLKKSFLFRVKNIVRMMHIVKRDWNSLKSKIELQIMVQPSYLLVEKIHQ